MWSPDLVKHCYRLKTSNVVVLLSKEGLGDQKPEKKWKTLNVSVSIEGLLLDYLHSTAWFGLTVKDQYGIYNFRSLSLFLIEFLTQGAFPSPGEVNN